MEVGNNSYGFYNRPTEEFQKAAHFIPIKSTYKVVNIVYIFMKEIFKLHGVTKVIVSYRDAKFIGNV